MLRVAIFTDHDFDTINGQTTTLRAVLAHAPADIAVRIYTASDFSVDTPAYLALRSWGIGSRGNRMYWPRPAVLRAHLTRERVDVVHLTTTGPMGLAGRYLAARLGLPVVGSHHTSQGGWGHPLNATATLRRSLEQYRRWLYAPCRPLLVPTERTAERLGAVGYRRERLVVWSPGIDTHRFSPDRRLAALRERWRVSDRRPAVLYVGRLSREKGVGLLAPISRLLDQQRVAHRLIVAGDGPMRDELRQRCPDAVFLGTLAADDLAATMASADVLVSPGTTDHFGHVVLEAQASGLPVVVAGDEEAGEHILPCESGFVCGGDPGRLACRLQDVLSDGTMRAHMGEAARTYALGRQWSSALAPIYAGWRVAPQPRRVAAAATRRLATWSANGSMSFSDDRARTVAAASETADRCEASARRA